MYSSLGHACLRRNFKVIWRLPWASIYSKGFISGFDRSYLHQMNNNKGVQSDINTVNVQKF